MKGIRERREEREWANGREREREIARLICANVMEL